MEIILRDNANPTEKDARWKLLAHGEAQMTNDVPRYTHLGVSHGHSEDAFVATGLEGRGRWVARYGEAVHFEELRQTRRRR